MNDLNLNLNGALQPAAEIRIVMMQDGNIQCQAAVPDRRIFLMMMEVAKADMERVLHQQEAQKKVQLPPPGMNVLRVK